MKMGKKIIITEEQFNLMTGKHPLDPRKVLYVKNFLDSRFSKEINGSVDARGEWVETPFAQRLDSQGNAVQPFSKPMLFYYLQSKFNEEKHLYGDEEVCDRFLKFVINAWFQNRIDKNGFVSGVNFF